MKKASPQTKSFILLAAIGIVGTYLAFFTFNFIDGGPKSTDYLVPQSAGNDLQQLYYSGHQATQINTAQAAAPVVNTSAWKTYMDQKYNFSFRYDPAWKILPAKTESGFYVLEIDPGKKYYNFKVLVSDKDFYAMDGLPVANQIINGQTAENLNSMLYGIQHGGNYYTFDLGLSLSLQPQFAAWVNTVTFN